MSTRIAPGDFGARRRRNDLNTRSSIALDSIGRVQRGKPIWLSAFADDVAQRSISGTVPPLASLVSTPAEATPHDYTKLSDCKAGQASCAADPADRPLPRGRPSPVTTWPRPGLRRMG